MKKVIVSVINDLSTDQRVHRTCVTLHNFGFNVLLVGRKQKNSLLLSNREYETKRIKLFFEKGPLFYAEYNLRLFFFLLFNKSGILVSNDLDTLLPNYIISKIKKASLVYDTHEIFTEVPELKNRKWKKYTWEKIEHFIFPKLKHIITVNDSIAKYYGEIYLKDLKVVRNIPIGKKPNSIKTRKELGLPADKKIIILQGSGINIDRGAEEAVEAMKHVNNAVLFIIGSGDIINKLKQTVNDLKISDKVKFINKLPPDELMHYTCNADIGLTLDKDTNINYRYSLPNKLFDYMHAGIPVLASPLVEIKKIFDQYNIGELIENHNPKHIAEKINLMLSNDQKIKTWKENSKIAISDLCWEKEEQELLKIFKHVA